jgi:hypothetical protein
MAIQTTYTKARANFAKNSAVKSPRTARSSLSIVEGIKTSPWLPRMNFQAYSKQPTYSDLRRMRMRLLAALNRAKSVEGRRLLHGGI